jgi:hypothetical protein
MDAADFDRLTRSISSRVSRRAIVGLIGLAALSDGGLAEARKHHRKKKVKTNEFGCVDVGKFCNHDKQCCSGVCAGKKGKGKGKAHDQSTCMAGQHVCLGTHVNCTTTNGLPGECITTTGKASYCFVDGRCVACAKDADCVPQFGAGAACVVCTTDCLGVTENSTACVGLNEL